MSKQVQWPCATRLRAGASMWKSNPGRGGSRCASPIPDVGSPGKMWLSFSTAITAWIEPQAAMTEVPGWDSRLSGASSSCTAARFRWKVPLARGPSSVSISRSPPTWRGHGTLCRSCPPRRAEASEGAYGGKGQAIVCLASSCCRSSVRSSSAAARTEKILNRARCGRSWRIGLPLMHAKCPMILPVESNIGTPM